jgi:hypothetical protein
MPTLLSDVGCWGQSGKNLLAASISPFDPERSSAAVFGNDVDIDQHLMMCIVDIVTVMLAVSSPEIAAAKVSQSFNR